MKRVVIESPYAASGDRTIADHVNYARRCMADSLSRDEAPYLSHLLYTQVLDDTVPHMRERGITAGFEWGRLAEVRAVYIDFGLTPGIVRGIDEAVKNRQLLVFRSLSGREGRVTVKMEGGPYHVPVGEEWRPPDPAMTLRDTLAQVSHYPDITTIQRWSRQQRDDARAWAVAVMKCVDDPEEPFPPPDKPPHLRGYDQPDLIHGLDIAEVQALGGMPGVEAVPDPTEPMHLWAMGGAETVCNIRKHPTLYCTFDPEQCTCPGCLSRVPEGIRP